MTYLLTLSLFLIILIFGFANFLVKDGFDGKEAEIKIGDAIFQIEIADSFLKRQKGLSGRKSLKENEGMLFILPIAANYGFWMRDMNFPIDIIWIKNDKIIGISENLASEGSKPLKIYYPPSSIDKALEVSAGVVSAKNIEIGDMLKY